MEGTMKVTDDIYDFSTIPEECIVKNMDNEEEEYGAHPYLNLKRDIENNLKLKKREEQKVNQ